MKFNKSIFFSIVLLVFVSYSLQASSSRAKATEKIQIRWYTQISDHEDDDVRIAKEAFVERFNNSQSEIELILVPTAAGCSFEGIDTLIMKIQEGNPPDITDLACSEVYEHLLDITPYLVDYDLSDLDSKFLNYCKVDNKLLEFPFGVGITVVFYNKNLFNKAGISYPPHRYNELYADSAAWNIQKLEEIAMLLTLDDNGKNANSPDFNPNLIEQYGYHWQWSFNTNMFGPGPFVEPNGDVSFPDHLQYAYKWHHDAMYKKHFTPTGEQFDSLEYETITTEKGAILLSYLYNAESFNDVPFLWDIAAVPSYNGKSHVPWYLMKCCILKTSKHPEEALKVILTIATDIELLTAWEGQLPVFKSLKEESINEFKKIYNSDVDWYVAFNSLNHLCASNMEKALKGNLAARRLQHDFENYVEDESDANIDGTLNHWLIPELKKIFSPDSIEDKQ